MRVTEIKEALSLPALAIDYGLVVKNNKAKCCFHNEKTASLQFHETWFVCFACGAKGDTVDFVSRIEGISKGRAIRMLSERTGIPLDNSPRRTPIQRAGDRQDLDFALWWHGRQVLRMSRQLTAYCIHATEDECEDLGSVLRQLRALNRQAIIGAARRMGTAEDWREWEQDRQHVEAVAWACVEMIESAA